MYSHRNLETQKLLIRIFYMWTYFELLVNLTRYWGKLVTLQYVYISVIIKENIRFVGHENIGGYLYCMYTLNCNN